MLDLLFLSLRFPHPPQRGDRIRAFYFMKELSKRYNITLVSFFESKNEIERIDKVREHCSQVEVIRFSPIRAYCNSVTHLFSSKPLQVGYWYSPEMHRTVDKLIESKHFDIIQAQFFRMAQYLTKFTDHPKVVDLTDALSLNLRRRVQLDKGLKLPLVKLEERRVRAYETEIINSFDAGTVVSSFDRDYLLGLDNSLELSVVPMGVDLDYFFPVEKGDYKPQILFTGTMNYFPNYDAVIYFCEKIFPIIQRELPDASFYVVGNNPNKRLLRYANNKIVITGHVADVRPYFADSAVSVCPLRSGSGMQAKNLEAMAMGVPVVTTTRGFQGLEATSGKDLLVADNPEDFANNVIQVIKEPEFRQELSENARKLVEAKYGWPEIVKRLDLIYQQISSRD